MTPYKKSKVFLVLLALYCCLLAACGGGGGGYGGDGGDNSEDFEADISSSSTGSIYVSLNGDDGNDGSSEGSPVRTIARAVAASQPGNTIFLRGGTYQEMVRINHSGSEDAPITYTSFPGEFAEIDGGDQGDNHAVILSANRVVLRGIGITNGGAKGLLILGDNNVIDGVVSHHNHGGPGIEVYRGDNNLIIRSIAHSNEDRDTGGEDADGIYLSGRGNRVHGCQMFGNSDDGFDGWESMDSVVEYSISYGNGNGRNGDGNGFKLSNLNGGSTLAQKNISYGNASRGFTTNGGSGHVLINNTAFGNGVNFQHVSSSREATFINNLSISGSIDLASGAEQRNNSWNLDVGDAGVVSRDPASADFLSLSPQSAAIDRGTGVDLPVSGAAPDLGALELGQRVGDLLSTP